MGDRAWTVWGVAELGCWILHRPSYWPTGHDAEDCIDAHLACGIDRVVWELGRSVLTYHSDVTGATCHGVGRHFDEFYPSLKAQYKGEMLAYRERCQLRAALTYGRSKGCTVYGRLCMNRHYGPGESGRSRFAEVHPQWCEVQKDGWLDPSRLCYAIPEYRQERVAILKEAALVGCDGLFVDFLRQPPMVRYHPALVNPYREKTGRDPRAISLAEKDAFLDWSRFRAQFVTALLRELKAALDPIRAKQGRRIPVQVRVPNDGLEANLIAGLDVRTWLAERLVDELALSELHWMPAYYEWDDRPYIALGREYGVPVFGSSNCLPVQRGGWGGQVNPRGVNPLVLVRRALRSLEDGAQGVCLYQSDTGIWWPEMPEALRAMGGEESLRRYVDDLANVRKYPITPENECFGIDNHSDSLEDLRRLEALGPEKFWL